MDKTIDSPTPEAEALAVNIHNRVVNHVTQATMNGKEQLARKWQAELPLLTAPPVTQALMGVKFNPDTLNNLAIYAAQKLRRMVQAYLGTGQVDPYTVTALRSAFRLKDDEGRVPSRALMATLTTKVPPSAGMTPEMRRKATVETAATQASSTRMALIALGAGRMEGKGRGATFVVDFNHPFVARVIGGAA